MVAGCSESDTRAPCGRGHHLRGRKWSRGAPIPTCYIFLGQLLLFLIHDATLATYACGNKLSPIRLVPWALDPSLPIAGTREEMKLFPSCYLINVRAGDTRNWRQCLDAQGRTTRRMCDFCQSGAGSKRPVERQYTAGPLISVFYYYNSQLTEYQALPRPSKLDCVAGLQALMLRGLHSLQID